MARSTCKKCAKPKELCLCSYLVPIQHATQITVIQCDKEHENAKNTANLLPLISSGIAILHADDDAALQSFRDSLTNRHDVAVLFPTNQALSILEMRERQEKIKHLIVIDGTWRKAKRFMLSNSWLNALPLVQLTKSYTSRYVIRKTSVENGLSTLEAVAWSISELEGCDDHLLGFFNLLDGINKQFMSKMPEHVRARYKT